MKTLGIVSVATLSLLTLPESAAQTFSKTETIEYHDNTSLWVLGQVKRTTTNGIETSTTTYDPVYALPTQTTSFGKIQQTLTYDTTSTALSGQRGTLKTTSDGRNGSSLDTTVTFSSWKRGIPQLIQFPATPDQPSGASKSAVVNAMGQIDSVTDENGYKTCYEYDAMGRMQLVTYPSETQVGVCDASKWSPTARVFAASTTAKYGLPAGHWQQIVTTGNGVQTTYYDGLWRPVVAERYDSANPAATRSVNVTRYDADGQPVFQSYPMASLTDFAAITQGTRTFYDALERVTKVEQDSEFGVLTTTTDYLAGLLTRTTNPRGIKTLIAYRAYDQPNFDEPHGIIQAEGTADAKATEIYRDIFGKPTALRRRNSDYSQDSWRRYVYDGAQQLCKVIEPETGSTVMDYDAAGNLAWSAAGHQLPDTTTCNTAEGYWWGRRVDRTYDARNRLKTLAFPDGRGNQSWTYYPDGLPNQITTYNESGNTGAVTNAYTYNPRRLLIGESLGQPDWYNWGIGYNYDANGNLANQQYPTTLMVYYAPNALGQATAITDSAGRTHASGVSYYPNGAIKQFTYGNGIVHTMQQNARQLPARSTGSGGALDDVYNYDANGNVDSIIDKLLGEGVYSPRSRWMTYDGLDRLTGVGAGMFGGTDNWHRFTYDALDNLKSWKLAGVKDYANYYYNPNTNQLTIIQNSAGASIVGLGYDEQGNLANKNGQRYVFDYGNRLRSVDGNRWYRYDGHGRRVINWPVTGAHGDLSQYSQDGKLIHLADYTDGYSAGGISRDHLYLGGSLLSIVEYRHSDWLQEVKYQHTDALGSPVAVTNQVGTVIDRTQWEPYGAAIGKPTYDGAGYTGHVMDGTTGLTYMQQRYYDPSIGRFLSVDPVTANSGTGANFNRYWYANNNPYRFTDPDGRRSKEENEHKREQAESRRERKEQRDRVRNSDMVIVRAQSNATRGGDALTDAKIQATALTGTAAEVTAIGTQKAADSLGKYGAPAAADVADWGRVSRSMTKLGIVGGVVAGGGEAYSGQTPADKGHGYAVMGLAALGFSGALSGGTTLGIGVLDMGVQSIGGWGEVTRQNAEVWNFTDDQIHCAGTGPCM